MPTQRDAEERASVPCEGWTTAAVEALAVRLLARREHSHRELGRKLVARGIPVEQAEEVLQTLQDRRLQSDERYAEALVHSRVSRGQGPARIRRDLSRQGIPDAAVDAVLAAAEVDWGELAREARRRHFGAEIPHEWKARARQARFLESRGFTGEQIRDALGD